MALLLAKSKVGPLDVDPAILEESRNELESDSPTKNENSKTQHLWKANEKRAYGAKETDVVFETSREVFIQDIKCLKMYVRDLGAA